MPAPVPFAPQLTTRTATAATTVAANEFVIADATTGALTTTGPTAGASRRWGVKKSDASSNPVTISFTDATGTTASIALLQRDDAKTFEPVGSGYAAVSSDRSRTLDDIRYNNRPYGLAIGRSGCNVPAGLHVKSNAQGLSDGTSTSSSYHVFVPLTDPTAGSVLPVFNGWYGGADTDAPNAFSVGAAVEARDSFGSIFVRPFTFGGAHLGTVNPGTIVTPDNPIAIGKQVTVTVTDAAGSVTLSGVWMRFYVSVTTAGMKWPIAIDPRLVSGEGNNGSSGADLTLAESSSTFSGAFSYSFGPAVVLASTRTRKPIVGLVSDSIGEGANDYVTTRGYIERVCEALGFPLVKTSRGGEAASNFAYLAGRKYRIMLLDGCTHIICAYGTNDLVNRGQTPAQLQANLTEIWTFAKAIGAKVYQATITPRTTSTDSWVSSGNQTASGASSTSLPADIAAVNAFIRTAAVNGTIDGVIDVADAVSTARDSGIWKSNTSASVQEYTNDGTHPSPLAHANLLKPLAQTTMAAWTA